jgi:hypothetical protein
MSEIQVPLPGFHKALGLNYLGSGRHKEVYDIGDYVLKVARDTDYSKPGMQQEVERWRKASPKLKAILCPTVAWADDFSWTIQVKCQPAPSIDVRDEKYAGLTFRDYTRRFKLSDIFAANCGIMPDGRLVVVDYTDW